MKKEIIFCLFIFSVFLVSGINSCKSAYNGSNIVTISEIRSNPEKFDNKEVTLIGEPACSVSYCRYTPCFYMPWISENGNYSSGLTIAITEELFNKKLNGSFDRMDFGTGGSSSDYTAVRGEENCLKFIEKIAINKTDNKIILKGNISLDNYPQKILISE